MTFYYLATVYNQPPTGAARGIPGGVHPIGLAAGREDSYLQPGHLFTSYGHSCGTRTRWIMIMWMSLCRPSFSSLHG